MNPYVPILVIGALGLGFTVFSVGVAAITGPKRYNRAKLDPYECGVEPSPQAAEGGRFPVKYFLTAMLFIIFDIEMVFLYPWAVTFDQLGLFFWQVRSLQPVGKYFFQVIPRIKSSNLTTPLS